MGDSGRENARFSFTGEIFVEEMRDFLDTWGIPVAKLFDFGVKRGIVEEKTRNFWFKQQVL